MLDTFIKSKGNAKTLIHNNNKNYYGELNWDADYDGNKANISLDLDENGEKEHIEMKMDNDQLAELLNIPSENNTLDKRLYNDFLSRRSPPSRKYRIIELPKKKHVHFNNNALDNIYTHISSPNSQEQIIFPLTVVNKTRRQHHKKKPKSHITYRVYRKKRPYTRTLKHSPSSSGRISKRSF